MRLRDSFSLAVRSISANRLRAGLTIFIIAFGIMALVGILTAIDAIKGTIFSSFSSMGANGFTIRNREFRLRHGGDDATRSSNKKKKVRTSNQNKVITFQEAMDFKERFEFPNTMVGLSFRAGGNMTVYKDDKKNESQRTGRGWGRKLPHA